VEADAALYLGTRDPRAAAKALEAARYYVKEGHLDAASDLLLQLIAAGVADHDAQRLLVDIVRTLGKREVAKTKCQLLAHALHLALTTPLLQALFAVALIALVVVFQPDLRRALGQIGQLGPLNRLLAPGSEEELEGIVDELVRAALLISEAKHGALIVLERATGLQDYSETGVPVNGKLTAELLASIFMTRSPLHDGAVIVRGGQILAAACLLPLEENTDRGAHRYGMRHRAALSISAQTDAIVVVVSEETQAISIAAGGRIIGALDEERLRRVL